MRFEGKDVIVTIGGQEIRGVQFRYVERPPVEEPAQGFDTNRMRSFECKVESTISVEAYEEIRRWLTPPPMTSRRQAIREARRVAYGKPMRYAVSTRWQRVVFREWCRTGALVRCRDENGAEYVRWGASGPPHFRSSPRR